MPILQRAQLVASILWLDSPEHTKAYRGSIPALLNDMHYYVEESAAPMGFPPRPGLQLTDNGGYRSRRQKAAWLLGEWEEAGRPYLAAGLMIAFREYADRLGITAALNDLSTDGRPEPAREHEVTH